MAKLTREEAFRKQQEIKYREEIKFERLLADYNKAIFEKMHYFVEGTKLIPEYSELIKKQEELQKQMRAEGERAIQEALSKSDPDPTLGSLEIDGAEITQP